MINAYKFSLNLKEREGEERFCFIAEWYDPHAAFIRRYQFMYYVKDGTVEMVSTCIKTQSVVSRLIIPVLSMLLLVMHYYYNKLENLALNICKDLMHCHGTYLTINVNICFVSASTYFVRVLYY